MLKQRLLVPCQFPPGNYLYKPILGTEITCDSTPEVFSSDQQKQEGQARSARELGSLMQLLASDGLRVRSLPMAEL